MNSKTIPAVIHVTLAVGATTTAPFFDVNIQQQLCQCSCVDDKPVFAPAFSVLGVEPVGTNQYLIYVHVEGVVNYVPCGCGSCATKAQVISQNFTVPFYSATAIKGATIEAGASQNAIVRTSCKSCSKLFESDTPITITPVTA